jgi:soluble lytic murein transglycosylase-like protein
MSSRDSQDEKPKRSRRKPIDQADDTRETKSVSADEPADEPKSPRRKRAAETAGGPATKEESGRRPRSDPAEKQKAAKPSSKPKAPAPREKKKNVPPIGRIARAIWLGHIIIRYAPIWIFVVLLLLLFGPALLRAIRPPQRVTTIATFFTPEVQYWAPKIIRWSQDFGVDPNLIATLMQIESCGFPGAFSTAGAQGLFQVMPDNFKPGDNMTDPDTNAARGIGVIRDCLGWAENDVGLAMACYNGGPSLIYASPSNWPDETQRYYTWGGGIFNDTQRGLSRSETLDNWLAAGGIGLCQRAAETLGLSTRSPQEIPTSVPKTPIPVLPTLPMIEPGPLATAVQPGSLPTFALVTDTPVAPQPPISGP